MEVIMRPLPAALLTLVSTYCACSIGILQASGENKIGLTAFEQSPPAQAVATSVVTPAAAMPRFAARSMVSQPGPNFPWRTRIQPRGGQPIRPVSKPFENVERDPTTSPYLNLDRDEDDLQVVPSYFTFVRPQLEQIQTNRMQQRELQQLRGQVQGMSMQGIGPQSSPMRAAGVGAPARFMDTAQFYGGHR
jgi:hypothetical protein